MNSPRPREGTLPMRVTVTTTATDVWVRIIGEADLSNRDQLQRSLSAINYQSARGVHVDLRQLTFCDTAACRVILRFERRVRLSGHQTEMRVSNSAIRKVIALLSRDDAPVEVSLATLPTLRIEGDRHGP